MSKFNSSQKIGDIATEFPKAKELFKEYKIDFWCGGDRQLTTAIGEQGLDETEILNRVNALYEKYANNLDSSDKNWQEAPLGEFVDYIVNKHHAYLWEELPRISKLTTTILRVHGPNHPELSNVHKLFHLVKMELEVHLAKEEVVQYTAIKKYEISNEEADLEEAIRIIKELQEEHKGAGDILKELRVVNDDYKIPDDVCGTYELTYTKLQEMESDLFQHIHLESNILFPRLLGLKID